MVISKLPSLDSFHDIDPLESEKEECDLQQALVTSKCRLVEGVTWDMPSDKESASYR